MTGISQSIVSMGTGRYISAIRLRPVVSVTCHLRLRPASSASRARSCSSRRSSGAAGIPAAAGPRVGAQGAGVAGGGDGRGHLVRADPVRVVHDGGGFGGEVHFGQLDTVEL